MEKIRFIGKHIKKDGMDYFSYSGSGFYFKVRPTSSISRINITFIGEGNDYDYQFIGIYVNDKFLRKERLIKGINVVNVTLKQNDDAIIKIIKLNEVYLSSIYLKDIKLENASMIDLDNDNHQTIGFFGDSITCGYGLDEFHGEAFSIDSEDFSKAYPYLSASELNMDYIVVARSGISLAIKIYCETLFNQIYDTVDMYLKGGFDKKLDFAVINLGTNDSQGLDLLSKEYVDIFLNKYVDEYKVLVGRIIKDNPNVKIILCYGLMPIREDIVKAIESIREYIKENYKNKCEIVRFIPNEDGANHHPYFTAHKKASELLIKTIKNM